MMNIRIRRVYDKADEGGDFRVLVDRLWPRGLSKNSLKLDVWARGISPSSQLRKWYSHEPKKWEKFKQAYWKELEMKKEEVEATLHHARGKNLTLLCASRDPEHSNAAVLRQFMMQLETSPSKS